MSRRKGESLTEDVVLPKRVKPTDADAEMAGVEFLDPVWTQSMYDTICLNNPNSEECKQKQQIEQQSCAIPESKSIVWYYKRPAQFLNPENVYPPLIKQCALGEQLQAQVKSGNRVDDKTGNNFTFFQLDDISRFKKQASVDVKSNDQGDQPSDEDCEASIREFSKVPKTNLYEIIQYYLQFLRGERVCNPTYYGYLNGDTIAQLDNIRKLNQLGFLTLDSQDGDEMYGLKEPSATYQRAYIDGFVPVEFVEGIRKRLQKSNSIVLQLQKSHECAITEKHRRLDRKERIQLEDLEQEQKEGKLSQDDFIHKTKAIKRKYEKIVEKNTDLVMGSHDRTPVTISEDQKGQLVETGTYGICKGIWEPFGRILSDDEINLLNKSTAYLHVIDMQWHRKNYLVDTMITVLEQVIAHDLTDQQRNYFRLNQKKYMQ